MTVPAWVIVAGVAITIAAWSIVTQEDDGNWWGGPDILRGCFIPAVAILLGIIGVLLCLLLGGDG